MATEIGPALGLTADSKGLEAAIPVLDAVAKKAIAAEKAADGLAGGGRRMSAGMAQALASLKSMDASLIKLSTSQQKSNDEADEAARKSAALAASYGSLRASLDPLYAASKKYEAALATLDAAQAAGTISDAERMRTLRMLDAQFAATNNATMRMAGGVGHAGNVFAQFNDIGMMAFSGQAPLLLAIQQGTQLNQVWGSLGNSTAAIGAAMKSAFGQLLNPIGLVTIGLIAGGAALVQWGMSALGAGADAKSFKDNVAAAETAINAINDATASLSRAGLEDLRAKYGDVNAEVRALVEQQRLLAIADGAKALNDALGGITESLGDGLMNTAYGELERTFNVTANSAQILYGVLQGIKDQKTIEGQLATLTAMKSRLSDATNGFRNMTTEQADMLRKLTEAESLIRQQQNALSPMPGIIASATSQTSAWAGAMSSVMSYVSAIGRTLGSLGSGGITLAAIQTETALLKQGKSLREASFAAAQKTNELEGAARTREMKAQYGIVGEMLATVQNNQKSAILTAQQTLDLEREAAREREKSASGGAAKGAAEVKAAAKGFQTIRELLEEDSLFQFAEQEKRQAQLDAALAKKLVSEQTYQEMSAQLRTMYFGSEIEQQTLRYQMDQEALQAALDQKLITEAEYFAKRKEMSWANLLSEENRTTMAQDLSNASQYFSQLYSMTGSSFDGLLKLQQGFSAAAALMNAWEAYTTVLADKTVPYWVKFAAAGQVLAAGFGAVRAIKGASKGGGGGAAAGGGATSPTAAAAPARPQDVILDYSATADPAMRALAAALLGPMIDQLQKASKTGINIVAVRS